MIEHKSHFGAKEWADKTKNYIRGCKNRCLYCSASADAIRRKQVDLGQWDKEVVNYRVVNIKNPRPKDYSIMLPSTHDFQPELLSVHIPFIRKMLAVHPKVLLVSKPRLEVIKAFCDSFSDYRDKLTFRFSIGTADDKTRGIWEPGASTIQERVASLEWAFEHGYQTSVSCEPMLDDKIDDVVRMVKPYITDTIWIGKINYLLYRLRENGHDNPEFMGKANQLIEWQSDANIHDLYQRLKDDPQIRWKESIQQVIGLQGPVQQ